MNQLSLQLWACCLYSKASFYRQHWAFAYLSRQSAHFFLSAKFSLYYFFFWELWVNLFLCVKILIRSDTTSYYFVSYCILLRNLFVLYIAITWCLNKMIIDEFLVNLVKIIDENSSNLINQQFSKLLRMTEFWSIHDKDWSSLKLEWKHNSTDLSAFSLQQIRALIYSNNH